MLRKLPEFSKRIAVVFALVCCVILTAAVMVACNNNDGPKPNPGDESKVTSVTITNKDELTAVWCVGDPNRIVSVKVEPNTEAENTAVTVRSSNTQAVAVVNNNKLRAVAAGKSTITVSAGDKTDEVEVTVSEALPVLSAVTVTNKTELEADMVKGKESAAERNVEVTLSPNGFTAENTEISLSSSDEEVIAVDGMKIKPGTKTGTATITVTAKDKANEDSSVTATFTVKYRDPIGAPIITFKDSDGEPITGNITTKVSVGIESALPDPEVVGTDGKNLHGNLQITCESDDVSIEYGQIKANKVAAYTVKYSVTDSRAEVGNGVTEKEITVYAYRNIFSYINIWGDGETITTNNEFDFETFDEAANIAGQTVIFNSRYWTQSKFNMPAGKVYYAEATFDAYGGVWDFLQPGFSHMVGDSISGRRYVNTVELNNNLLLRSTDWMKDGVTETYDTVNTENGNKGAQPFVHKIGQTRGIDIAAYGENHRRTVKIAVARDGDYFYTFVNDVYVACTTPVYYRDKDTVPGLFGFGLMQPNEADNTIAGQSTASHIDYMSGAEAQAKLKTLIGEHNEKMMAGYLYYPTAGSAEDADYAEKVAADNVSINKNNALFTNTYSETNGLGLNYTKDGNGGNRISPYIYFDGNFTFSYTFKPRNAVEADNGTKYQDATYLTYMEGRSFSYNDPGSDIFQLGLRYREADGKGWSAIRLSVAGGQNAEPANLIDISQGVKFTVKRVLKSDGALFEIEARSVAVPTQKVTRQFLYQHRDASDPRADWDQPFLPVIFHENMPGTYSHIEWSTSATIVETPEVRTEINAADYGTQVDTWTGAGCHTVNATDLNGEYTLVIEYKATDLTKNYGIYVCVGPGCSIWGSADWTMWYVGGEAFYDISLAPTGENGVGYLVIKLNLTASYSDSNKCYVELSKDIVSELGEKVTVNNVTLYKAATSDVQE